MEKVLLLVLLAFYSLNGNAQTREKKYFVHDGFSDYWYLTCKDGKYGAEDINGNEIVPARYAGVSLAQQFSRYPCFIATDKKSYKGYEAVYDIKGNLIIPLSRHYRVIKKGESPELGTYYTCTNNEYNNCMVICNKNGEIVRTIYPEKVVGRIIDFNLHYINNSFYIRATVDTDNCEGGRIGGILFDGNGKIIRDFRNGDFKVQNGVIYDYKNGKWIPSTTKITTTTNPLKGNTREVFVEEKMEGKFPYMYFINNDGYHCCSFTEEDKERNTYFIITTTKTGSEKYYDMLGVHPLIDETLQTWLDNNHETGVLNMNFRLSNGSIKVVSCVLEVIKLDDFGIRLLFYHEPIFEQYDITSISYLDRTFQMPIKTSTIMSKMVKYLRNK